MIIIQMNNNNCGVLLSLTRVTLTTQRFLLFGQFPQKQLLFLQQSAEQFAASIDRIDNIFLFSWLQTDMENTNICC